MHAQRTFSFSGRISVTTPDGRSAFVRLDEMIDGKDVVVISPETEGRIAVMNGVGRLEEGVLVEGEAEAGPEALRAVSISPQK